MYVNGCHILVNLSTRRLDYYELDRLVKEYPIGIGTALTPTPTGKYSITEKVLNPQLATFGTRNLHLSNTNTCIHGTNDPSSIGGLVSGG